MAQVPGRALALGLELVPVQEQAVLRELLAVWPRVWVQVSELAPVLRLLFQPLRPQSPAP